MQGVLREDGILQLPRKWDLPKFKHGIRFVLFSFVFFFFASTCMLGIWEIICLSGKCESTRCALSVVSFQTKL